MELRERVAGRILTKNSRETVVLMRVRRQPGLGSLQALLALRHFEFDALVFLQRLEAVALDLAEMREQVVTARVRGDEAEALAFVEPFDGAGLGSHEDVPQNL